jgi:hypothetical protein
LQGKNIFKIIALKLGYYSKAYYLCILLRSKQKNTTMTHATLVHIETGIEYHNHLGLFSPTDSQKLLWSIFGTPENVTRIERVFETEIDSFTGYTKKEVEAKCNQNFKSGCYSFLPPMGVNHSVELRYGK